MLLPQIPLQTYNSNNNNNNKIKILQANNSK